MLTLTRTTIDQISTLVDISKAAFDSDVAVGAPSVGGPPEYDSVAWHVEMMEQGHLFTAMAEDAIVGGAVLFRDENNPSFLYVGRIFISPVHFKKGYGMELMKQIEAMDSNITTWCLDTPTWNRRTNRLYHKLGYVETKREDDMVFYQKGSW